ncbi:unnamed protein product [Rotaria socialis]|uniref:Uncharacterized protein n=1 Tax=Rotaria socialis TaxID=392032 RepID=A0A820V6U0_9BILA|nr:unnamed protein product [Rotaria socialis]CAF3684687.1 unnamed protein product [Rotaria socialis]CAF4425234.1 unnamed protein product [Rotaria socialis]CAF4496417.1 unnamed protein product [Rotaria socialis]
MGTCTSTTRHRQKDHQQLHRRIPLKNSFTLDSKQISLLPVNRFPNNHQPQRSHPSTSNFDVQSSSLKDPIFHPINSNSLIQLYLPNINNSDRSSWMSSSSFVSHVPTRIPLAKSRLSTQQTQSSTGHLPSKNVATTVGTTNQPVLTRPMSTTNRAPPTSTVPNSAQHRPGFIPRPIASGLQQAQTPSLVTRSRSVSPSSTISVNSASTTVSQRLTKTQTIPKTTTNRSVPSSSSNINQSSKSKIVSSSHNTKDSVPSKLTISNRLRSNAPSQISTASSSLSTPTVPPTKTNVNAIRDRYKSSKRIPFYGRRTSIPNSHRSPSAIKEDKNETTSTDEHTTNSPIYHQTDDLKTDSSQQASSSHGDSAYASVTPPVNRLPSVHYSQINRQRQRAPSTLSSSSHSSDVLHNDAFLDDENCSLKSDDLICDYDDTLTLESVSKNERTDSFSSTSLSIEINKKSSMPTSITVVKPTAPLLQSASKENRPTTIAKSSPTDKINASLRESLDELTQLSNRMDNAMDGEHNRRLLARSVSLKPPATSLPPREDGEQIIMDIEAYRQVMKDVTVVKTIFHQLDRLLKHSDGTNMTDSMIGSFHETMLGSRHYSTSSMDGNLRNSIDENSTYDDLVKEIIILRKEREQDKQTIKLLQDQMYKYSSQTNV